MAMRVVVGGLLVAACVAAASNVTFTMHKYPISSHGNCSDTCSEYNLPCLSGVNVTKTDTYRTGECVGDMCITSSCDVIPQYSQVCACLDRDVSLDVSSNDTQTMSAAALVFNVSSIADECTSLHALQLQRELDNLNVIGGLCDPSNYVVKALASCDLIQTKGMYVSFTSNITLGWWGTFEYVIRSAFYQRFNTRAIDVTLGTYNGTSGMAMVTIYQLPQSPVDIRIFDGVRNTTLKTDTAPFSAITKGYTVALYDPMHMEMRVDGFFTRVVLMLGMEAYNNKSSNDLVSMFTGPVGSTHHPFVTAGVEFSYPLLTLSAPFTKFESASCKAVYAPEHPLNFPLIRDVFSVKALDEFAATMNVSKMYSRFDDMPSTPTAARGAQTAGTFVETYFNTVDYAMVSSLALSMNMTALETYMFNTTNSSAFGNAHVIRGSVVAVPMGDASVKAGKAGIRAVPGVVGNPTTGYILRAPAAACTNATVARTIELIKASNSPAYTSGGWVGAAACWPPAPTAAVPPPPGASPPVPSKKSFMDKYGLVIYCAAAAIGLTMVIVVIVAVVRGRSRNGGGESEGPPEIRQSRRRALLVLR